MSRRALWIIGVSTAIITSVALHAAVGHRYYAHRDWKERHCMQPEKTGERNNIPPVTDSTRR